MENKNIILILLIVIVILAVAMGVIFSQQFAKEQSKLTIAHKNISAGNSLVVELKDNQGKAISDAKIHVKLTGNSGKAIEKDIKTNSKGKAKLTVNNKGNYSVECKFDGNDAYASSSISDNVIVKKATTKVVSEEKTSSSDSSSSSGSDSSSGSGLSEDGYSYYPEYGPDVDSAGVTRERAQAENMHYIEMRVDGDRPGEYVTVGGYVKYDPVAGCYHT